MSNGDDGHLGEIVHHYVYTPFGDESYSVGTYENVSHRYTGQILDEDTGLYYYNARYYDAELARFVQADSEFATGAPDSQGLNRYAYCANNPLIYTDPSGNFVIEAMIASAIIGALVGGAVGAGSAAIMGGDIGKGALYGAIAGAIGGGFANIGAQIGQAVGNAAYTQGMTFTELSLAGKVGSVAGSAAAGALSATVTGGDPGISAITAGISAGVGGAAGLGTAEFLSGDWFGQLAISTCLSAGIGGTVAEIKGGDFWRGAGQASLSSATGFVVSSAITSVQSSDGTTSGVKAQQSATSKANLGEAITDVFNRIYGLFELIIVRAFQIITLQPNPWERTYKDMNDAAKAVLDWVYPLSRLEKREYGGLIEWSPNGYKPGKPVQGGMDFVTLPPKTAATVGGYHTHPYLPGYDYNNFSSPGGDLNCFHVYGQLYLKVPLGNVYYLNPRVSPTKVRVR